MKMRVRKRRSYLNWVVHRSRTAGIPDFYDIQTLVILGDDFWQASVDLKKKLHLLILDPLDLFHPRKPLKNKKTSLFLTYLSPLDVWMWMFFTGGPQVDNVFENAG